MQTLARGLIGQFEVVHALALRETRTRFGAHQLGYLWALLEPMVMIGTFVIVFLVANRPAPEGMDLYGFTATGLVPYLIFSNSLNQVANAIAGNKSLLFYPRVHILDLVIARAALELATYFAILIVLMGGHALWNQHLELEDPLMVVGGLILSSLLGTAVGLIFLGLAQYSRLADRIRGPLVRPMFWISGIFFTAAQLPDGAREPLLINPLLHTIEMTRAGFYKSYSDQYATPKYVLMFILVALLVGLLLERTVRRQIDMT